MKLNQLGGEIMSQSAIKGGAARLNGVIFYTDNYRSVATRGKDGQVIVQVKKRSNITSSFERNVRKIPIIRGLFLLLSSALSGWKIYLFTFVPLMILLFWNKESIESGSQNTMALVQFSTIIQDHFLIVIIILLLLYSSVIKFSSIGKYHAAEHMTDSTYDKLGYFSIPDVKKQSRVHKNCGTNIVVFILLIFFILSFVISNNLLLLILSFVFAYEVYLIELKLLAPFYWVGALFQYTLFTSTPTDKHLEVAMASYEALIKAENGEN